MEKVVAVAMSGGVDSSLTAAMLLKQGYKVFGITLWLWVSGTDYDSVPLAVTDAKKMCDFLGIEHHVIDARDVFYENVVDYFVKEYSYGRTPNPCVFCNKNIKFDLMLERAIELGATHMVTGHYAQVNYNEEAKRYELKLLEEKLNTANQSNSASNAVNNQLQQLTDLEVKDRLAYSTIRLEFFQQPKVRKSHDLNIHRIASLDSDPLLTRIAEAFKIGLSYFKETLIWLIQFWAFYIVIIAIWLIRKAYKTRKQNP